MSRKTEWTAQEDQRALQAEIRQQLDTSHRRAKEIILRGGVAIERWHLSYLPLADQCQEALNLGILREGLAQCDMALAAAVDDKLEEIHDRFIKLPAA